MSIHQSASLTMLPLELDELITRHLSPHDLVRLSRSCRAFSYAAPPESIARAFCHQYGYDAFHYAKANKVRNVAVYKWFLKNIALLGSGVNVEEVGAAADDSAAILTVFKPGWYQLNSTLISLAHDDHLAAIDGILTAYAHVDWHVEFDFLRTVFVSGHLGVFSAVKKHLSNNWAWFVTNIWCCDVVSAGLAGHWHVVQFVVDEFTDDPSVKPEIICAAKLAFAVQARDLTTFTACLEVLKDHVRLHIEVYALAAKLDYVDAMFAQDQSLQRASDCGPAFSAAIKAGNRNVFEYIMERRGYFTVGPAHTTAVLHDRQDIVAVLEPLTTPRDIIATISALFDHSQIYKIDGQLDLYESKVASVELAKSKPVLKQIMDKAVSYGIFDRCDQHTIAVRTTYQALHRIMEKALSFGLYNVVCRLFRLYHAQWSIIETKNCAFDYSLTEFAIMGGHSRVFAKMLVHGVEGRAVGCPYFDDRRKLQTKWTFAVVECMLLAAFKFPEFIVRLETIGSAAFKVRLKDAFKDAVRIAREEGLDLSQQQIDQLYETIGGITRE